MVITVPSALISFSVLILFSLCFASQCSASFDGSSFFNHQFLHNHLSPKPNFYHDICPKAEEIIRETMMELYEQNPSTAPQLLRLFFHDCIVGGCDASILLEESGDPTDNRTEKVAPPNKTLKGFKQIDVIKSRLEKECPGVVSCADTLALAAREGVYLAGGPFYRLLTGRGDSDRSFFEWTSDIPSPNDSIKSILIVFKQKGFTAKETVSLLASHNIGEISCEFVVNRLRNFSGTGEPDPSIQPEFLEVLRNSCRDPTSKLSSGDGFDSHFFKEVLKGTAMLFSDQQLLADELTAKLVTMFANSDGASIRRDFGKSMTKLSGLHIAKYQGSVRRHCARLPPTFGGSNVSLVISP